jgi:hypothetical protein
MMGPCYDCNRSISTRADACPYCGYPGGGSTYVSPEPVSTPSEQVCRENLAWSLALWFAPMSSSFYLIYDKPELESLYKSLFVFISPQAYIPLVNWIVPLGMAAQYGSFLPILIPVFVVALVMGCMCWKSG